MWICSSQLPSQGSSMIKETWIHFSYLSPIPALPLILLSSVFTDLKTLILSLQVSECNEVICLSRVWKPASVAFCQLCIALATGSKVRAFAQEVPNFILDSTCLYIAAIFWQCKVYRRCSFVQILSRRDCSRCKEHGSPCWGTYILVEDRTFNKWTSKHI